MATQTSLTNNFRVGLFAGNFNLPSDTIRCALYSGETHDQNTGAYTVTNESVGTAYVAGGQIMTGYTAAVDTTNHVAYLDWNNPEWLVSSITASACMIYNDTATAPVANSSMSVHDFGSPKTSSAGTFSVIIPAAAYNTAVIRFA